MPERKRQIAFLTSDFGSLSHTFIRREAMGLLRLHDDWVFYGMHADQPDQFAPEEAELYRRVVYLYPLDVRKAVGIVCAHVRCVYRRPKRYLRTLWGALRNEETRPLRHLKLMYHFLLAPYVACHMERHRVGHIHTHFLNMSTTIAMYCAQLLGITFSPTVHSAGTRSLQYVLGLRQKLREAEFICAISEYNRRYIDDIVPCREKTFIIRCGVDPDVYRRTNVRKNQWAARTVRLMGIGRFVEKKGFRYFVQAVRYLQREGWQVTADVFGDGPLSPGLHALVHELGLEENFRFQGACGQERIRRELELHDILIVPSVTSQTGEMEGIPVVIMEAMALEVPVVASRHSGIPELVRHEETGLLVEEKDAAGIAAAVQRLASDADLREACIRRGRALVEEEFNTERSVIRKNQLLEKTL